MAVPATRVADVDSHPDIAGAFAYYADGARETAGITYACPCGCGRRSAIEFKPTTSPGASWSWNGNREKPTLDPSVRLVIGGRTHWHGWLRAGVWVPSS